MANIYLLFCFVLLTPVFGKWQARLKSVMERGYKAVYEHRDSPSFTYDHPEHISYGSKSYPVSKHVSKDALQYAYSGRYNVLLTGLALYNMGRISSLHNDDDYKKNFKGKCMLGILGTSYDYQEVEVECQFMSNLILHKMKGVKHIDFNEEWRKLAIPLNPRHEIGSPIEVTEGMTCFLIHNNNVLKSEECGLFEAYFYNSFYWKNLYLFIVLAVVGAIIVIFCCSWCCCICR